MKKKMTLGFLVAVAAIIAVFFGITQKVYPVATVNDVFIPARQFQWATVAAQTYYEKIAAAYGDESATADPEFASEMRRAALQALIEDTLIMQKLATLYEQKALDAAVSERVAVALASSTELTATAVSELFGLSLEQFSEVVLAPRARFELLEDELTQTGETIDAWLTGERSRARVSIALNDLVWINGRVELSGEQSYTAKVKEAFQQIASTTAGLVASSTVSSSSVPR